MSIDSCSRPVNPPRANAEETAFDDLQRLETFIEALHALLIHPVGDGDVRPPDEEEWRVIYGLCGITLTHVRVAFAREEQRDHERCAAMQRRDDQAPAVQR